MTTETDVSDWVRQLLSAGLELSRTARQEIAGLGEAVVPALVAILEDRALWQDDGPGDGWAPLHAADLLGDIGSVAAIEPLLRLLGDLEVVGDLHDAIVDALVATGEAAVAPTWRAFADSGDPEVRASLAAVLARLGERDDRILAALVEHLARDPEGSAIELANYGDAAALPGLVRAFDDHELVETDDPDANQALLELAEAIEDLGGALTDAQHDKLFLAVGELEPYVAQVPVRRPPRPGRNEPCWCGSARKYKKCHLASDEAGETSPGGAPPV